MTTDKNNDLELNSMLEELRNISAAGKIGKRIRPADLAYLLKIRQLTNNNLLDLTGNSILARNYVETIESLKSYVIEVANQTSKKTLWLDDEIIRVIQLIHDCKNDEDVLHVKEFLDDYYPIIND